MEYKLKALISEKETDKFTIRLNKKARDMVGLSVGSYLDAWVSPFSALSLYKIRKAFKSDIKTAGENGALAFMPEYLYKYRLKTKDGYISVSPRKDTCIGSDPEFVIFTKFSDAEYHNNNEEYVNMYASEVLPFESEIGSDGPLGELRAQPGQTPIEHVNNLGHLIETIYDKLDPSIYKCKIFPYLQSDSLYRMDSRRPTLRDISCGGHIHFGLSGKIKNDALLGKLLSYTLDRLLTIGMHRVDMDMGIKRIVHLGYGATEDFKNNGRSLEYRGLSATWLLYRDLAITVLSIANSIVESISNRISNCIDDPNNSNWSITEDITGVHGNTCNPLAPEIIIIQEIFPEFAPILENYNNAMIDTLFVDEPNSERIMEYIDKSLRCLHSLIDSPELDNFSNLVTADYDKYKNLDPNFIENWGSDISVFDHLNS